MLKKNQAGFTLLEIMIVLAILGAAIGIVASRIQRKDTNIKAVVRNMTTMTREIRNKAKLYNSTYRLVINVDPTASTYWVERATGKVLRESKEEIEEKSKMDKDDKPVEPFKRDSDFGKKEKTLPSGLHFASIETINSPEPVTSGVGYIYFSPEGFVEYSALQITNGKELTWTLVFNPLTGQADIVPEAKALKDLKQ